ncbi:MAG: hypothetical protein N3I35_04650 [Clostridia bacterium]|nr:hypothetical protein [Clostridia bacterium]
MSISFNPYQNTYTHTNNSFSRIPEAADNISGNGKIAEIKGNEQSDPYVRMQKRIGQIDCETCSNRKYQDGSNDPGVSFKTPAHIDPSVSASVVMSHEQEHVRNESAKAAGENRKVISQSVKLETSVCPECGRSYVSGGETRTVTKADNKKDFFMDNVKKIENKHFGKELDVRV